MSKWSLEKILACDEIKFWTMFHFGGNDNASRIVLRKNKKEFLSFRDCQFSSSPDNWYSDMYAIDSVEKMIFFRPDGTIIEPPKDKKKIKIEKWLNIYLTSDMKAYVVSYNTKEEADLNGLLRIACEYFERKVEVEE